MFIPTIGNDWDDILKMEFKKIYFQNLMDFIMYEYQTTQVCPAGQDIFNALRFTPYACTRVVILGQAPYINQWQSHGFSYSVPPGAKIPPALQNIFRELSNDLGYFLPNNGCLIPWALQGVLLLNSVLTVECGNFGSHDGKGWEVFTQNIIHLLNNKTTPVVFMLWGKDMQQLGSMIDPNRHLVLKAPHPSPLAGGQFFGCHHFSKCNDFLYSTTGSTIDWQIPNIFPEDFK